MAVRAVENNDGIGSDLEGRPSLVYHEDGVEKSTEMVTKEKEAADELKDETTDG